MSAKRLRFTLKNYPDVAGRKLLFDTNVWLLIQGYFTNSRDSRVRLYSGFYEHCLERGAEILIPQAVLSEFVNRVIRTRANECGWDGKGKIHHQLEYNDWIEDAANDIHHISSGASFVADAFSEVSFDRIVELTKQSTLDFNDILIKELCKRCGYALVTDDADFVGCDVDLMTGNSKLVP